MVIRVAQCFIADRAKRRVADRAKRRVAQCFLGGVATRCAIPRVDFVVDVVAKTETGQSRASRAPLDQWCGSLRIVICQISDNSNGEMLGAESNINTFFQLNETPLQQRMGLSLSITVDFRKDGSS